MGLCVTGMTKINYRGAGERKSGNNVAITVDGTAESSAGRRLSHVLIPGTPARFGVGTLAVKAAPSKRRNSPEFTCRTHVCIYVWENHYFNSAGIAHNGIIRAFSIPCFAFARAVCLCSRAVVRSG